MKTWTWRTGESLGNSARERWQALRRAWGRWWGFEWALVGVVFFLTWAAVSPRDAQWQREVAGWDGAPVFRREVLAWLSQVVKTYGDFYFAQVGGFLLLLGLAWGKRSRWWQRVAVAFLLAGLTAGLSVNVLKSLVGKARPSTVIKLELVETPRLLGPSLERGWRSYPSGHTFANWACLTVLALAFPRKIWVWALFGGVIAWARVWGNFHYPLDVVHGALLGVLVGGLWGAGLGRRWEREG